MSALRRIRWAVASLGRKPGADHALTMLLGVADLPGGPWKQLDQRTWRTGEANPGSDQASRAREIGSITSWRSFEDVGRSRWLWCQVTPLACAEDAVVSMGDLPSKMLRNLRADVEVVASRDVAPPTVPGTTGAWAREQTTSGPRGDGIVLFLAAQVGRGLSVLCASGSSHAWDWPSLEALAAVQASRVEAILGRDG